MAKNNIMDSYENGCGTPCYNCKKCHHNCTCWTDQRHNKKSVKKFMDSSIREMLAEDYKYEKASYR